MAKKRSRSKPKPRTKIQRHYDLKQNILTLTYPDQTEKRFAFIGLPASVFTELAMRGAADILSKKADPDKTWANIKQGDFGRYRVKRHYPLVVRALALRLGVDKAEAQTRYDALSSEEKKALRTSPKMEYYMAGVRITETETEHDSLDDLPPDPIDQPASP